MNLFEFDFFIDGHIKEIYIAAETMGSAFDLAIGMYPEQNLVGVIRKNGPLYISVDLDED